MKILIIEDEARIARRIERMTNDFFEGNAGITIVDSLKKGVDFLEKETINILLLDLNLNGRDGFEVLGSMTSRSFQTIVVSANTENALRAFELGVLDFVPKPFDRERLSLALGRAVTVKKEENNSIRYLSVRKSGSIKLIELDQLVYIQGAGIYSEIHLLDGARELHDKGLDTLEKILPLGFERIHKSYIVNIIQVDRILVSSGSRYHLQLKNGAVLPIGRSRYRGFRELFEKRVD
ncbi:LytR/AlgR family response regulator transcription factor [Pedobacter sp. UBA5917]|jgi:DNA-binding LytR/AlgR family response regulator|uniref:LytR/AlgR family response regulator transcription factor n=1 Tax=Pedobacter sp. UBA5917 TaxID=1947061 RepID=UPI0025FAE122|nr:LytTR family DNA-binding domain-containing protein [Pedobacter sp. UBA5917]